MDLEDISAEVKALTKEVYELKGQVTALTAIVGVYQTQTSKLEGRQWTALATGFSALIGMVVQFIMGKH